MANWKNTRAGRTRIKAMPSNLSCITPTRQGNVCLKYENRSLLPVILTIDTLKPDDENVADSCLNVKPPFSIVIPRRPNIRSARKPMVVNEVIGTWEPKQQGHTTLRAKLDIDDAMFKQYLKTVLADDCVQVI